MICVFCGEALTYIKDTSDEQVRNFRCSFEYSQLMVFYKTGVCLVSLKWSVEDGKGKSHYSCPELLGASKKKNQ